jgi:hypothetical protein
MREIRDGCAEITETVIIPEALKGAEDALPNADPDRVHGVRQ